MTYDWDREHSNMSEIWAREADKAGLRQATKHAAANEFHIALAIWRDLAARGSVWSMKEIGLCLENGRSVDRDLAEAERWYKQAFTGGSQIAMLRGAKMAASRGDYAACKAMLQVGVEQDWAPAMFWLAWYRRQQAKSPSTYLSLLRTAARRGHPAAQAFLASFMAQGLFGFWRVPLGFFLVLKWNFQIDFSKPDDGAQAATLS